MFGVACARTVSLCSRPAVRAYCAIDLRVSIVTERVTLITGASAGIGTELARVFASKATVWPWWRVVPIV